MPRPTPGISTRDFARLLRAWGCEVLRVTDGHTVWRAPSGGRIVSTTEGRVTDPTFKQVKQAANALNLSTEQFLTGPDKKGTTR